MKKGVGTAISIILVIASAITGGLFSGSDEMKCVKSNSWIVKNSFRIEQYDCTKGDYYEEKEYRLYKGEKLISDQGFLSSNVKRCWIDFAVDTNYHIRANTCKRELIELRPNKKQIVRQEIDSAYIFSMARNKGQKLSDKALNTFVTKWNTAKIDEYRSKKVVSPLAMYDFRLELYQNKKKA